MNITKSGYCVAVVGATGAVGRATLHNPGRGPNALRTTATKTGDIELVTIPQVLARPELTNTTPLLLKIDIEGAESELFSAPALWLGSFPLAIIELHDWLLPGQKTSMPVLSALATSGRDFLHSRENIFSFHV